MLKLTDLVFFSFKGTGGDFARKEPCFSTSALDIQLYLLLFFNCKSILMN